MPEITAGSGPLFFLQLLRYKQTTGDMFPLVDREYETITQDNLNELRSFILGESELASRQMVLWPLYSFNVIPIQLISNIYELFFHLAEVDPAKEKGTYYTPYHLVEMLMDEVLPWEGPYRPMKILDPSCGSGVFLVEAYRRLISKRVIGKQSDTIGVYELKEVLQSCIFGIDCNDEAVRIASFSLSLAMCDFLEPRTIWDELQFPRLLHYNLYCNDFFEQQKDWEKQEFDIVIGNPPWESRLTDYADYYIKETKCVVGDKQIAQAFTWRAIDVCPHGTICFLLPSKDFLFNRSPPTKEYRKRFFDQCDVSVIINYSIFRKGKVLFEHATGPAVGVVFRAQKTCDRNTIFYCTPKPLYTVEDKRRFLIEPNDICRIPAELSKDDLIWKIAMWGGPRDLDLIHSLQTRHPTTFQSILDGRNMAHAEGFKLGNRKTRCSDFLDWPLIEAESFNPGRNIKNELRIVDFSDFECVVKKNRSVFLAPHLVIKQSPKNARLLADVLDFDAVFNHSLLGVHGDADILKYLCLIINSKVFSYYQMMTNRRWLVERDELEAGDILSTPIPSPTKATIEEAAKLFQRVFQRKENISIADEFAYRQYGLRAHEIPLVTEAIDYTYDYYRKKGKSIALKPPSEDELQRYIQVLKEVLRNSLGQTFRFSCRAYRGSSPLLVASLNFSAAEHDSFVNLQVPEMTGLLEKLDRQLVESRSGSVFVKRNARIYSKDQISIIKPNQIRYWNYTAACRDADELYADVMRIWRNENE